jgi:hypothetical protein
VRTLVETTVLEGAPSAYRLTRAPACESLPGIRLALVFFRRPIWFPVCFFGVPNPQEFRKFLVTGRHKLLGAFDGFLVFDDVIVDQKIHGASENDHRLFAKTQKTQTCSRLEILNSAPQDGVNAPRSTP